MQLHGIGSNLVIGGTFGVMPGVDFNGDGLCTGFGVCIILMS